MNEKETSLISISLKMVWKRWWSYTKHPIFRTLSVFVRENCLVLVLMLVMPHVGSLKGWNFYEIILCQGFLSITYGILLLFFTGLRDFESARRDLPILLLRPKGVLWQLLLLERDWFAVVGHLALGILLFFIANLLPIQVTVLKVVVLLLNLAGGVMIQAAIWLFKFAAACFFGRDIGIDSIFWTARRLLAIPLSFYSTGFGMLFVFVFPFGFVSYFPVLNLLGKTDVHYPEYFGFLALPIGIVMYLAAYFLWRKGLAFYRKEGHKH